jgi:hypothetical protein
MRLFWFLMSLPTLFALLLTTVSFVGCNAALDVPAEQSLRAVEGRVISSSVTTGSKGSVSGVAFQLSGRPETWHYKAFYPNFREAQSRLVPGARVRIWTSPDGRRSRWRPDFWGLEVSGSTVLTFQGMKSRSKQHAREYALAGSLFLLGSAFLVWKYGSLVRDELSYPRAYRYPGQR